MSLLSFLFAIAIALSFLAAAIGKGMVFERAQTSLATMGIPARLSKSVLIAILFAEVLTALVIIMPISRSIGAVMAILMLGSFTGVVLGNLVAGHRPACNCFGGSDDRPFGTRQFIRNALLVTLAVSVFIFEESQPMRQLTILGLCTIVVGFASFSFVLLRLMRRLNASQNSEGDDQVRDDRELQPILGHDWVGKEVTEVIDSDGISTTNREALRKYKRVLVIFSSVACSGCENVVNILSNRSKPDTTVIFISQDEETSEDLGNIELAQNSMILKDYSSSIMRSFGFQLLPTAIYIEENVILEWAVGEAEIRAMVSRSELPKVGNFHGIGFAEQFSYNSDRRKE